MYQQSSRHHPEQGKTWKSHQDAFDDISQLNDFGRTSDNMMSECVKSDGKRPSRSEPEKFLDPRTGEVVDINSFIVYDARCGRGRGAFIEDYKESAKLTKQLRMNRPLGLGNDVIELYFPNSKEPIRMRKDSASDENPPGEGTTKTATTETTTSSIAMDKHSDTQIVYKQRKRPRNVLIAGLLERKRILEEQNGNLADCAD